MGNHSTVLPWVKVGKFATVGAGAVVNRDIPEGATAVGVPAKVIKESTIHEKMRIQNPKQIDLIEPRLIRQSI